jgi:hypothetical protein
VQSKNRLSVCALYWLVDTGKRSIAEVDPFLHYQGMRIIDAAETLRALSQ